MPNHTDDVEIRVREILENIKPGSGAWPSDRSLHGGGGLDSLEVLLLLDAVEAEFGVHVPDGEVSKHFGNVLGIVEYLQHRSAADAGEQE